MHGVNDKFVYNCLADLKGRDHWKTEV